MKLAFLAGATLLAIGLMGASAQADHFRQRGYGYSGHYHYRGPGYVYRDPYCNTYPVYGYQNVRYRSYGYDPYLYRGRAPGYYGYRSRGVIINTPGFGIGVRY